MFINGLNKTLPDIWVILNALLLDNTLHWDDVLWFTKHFHICFLTWLSQ